MPLYVLGLEGMTRRLQHINNPEWQPLLLVAEAGAVVIMLGIGAQILQLAISIMTRESRRDLTGDPWNARTLEWATASPPPAYNFALMPQVDDVDAFWEMKRKRDLDEVAPTYEAIEMPRNTPTGIIAAFFAVVTGFALIWHIWWAVILGLLGAVAVLAVFGWSENREFEIEADEVARIERSQPSLGRAA
jgi:cytochrome o ubiquinol oxidase subunit 1